MTCNFFRTMLVFIYNLVNLSHILIFKDNPSPSEKGLKVFSMISRDRPIGAENILGFFI